MFGYILVIYLIIGIIAVAPLAIYGVYATIVDKEDINLFGDSLHMLGMGLGMLFCVIIWPYYVGYVGWKTYFKD